MLQSFSGYTCMMKCSCFIFAQKCLRIGKFREGKLYCVCYACRVSIAACNVCVGMYILVGVNVSVIMCILVWIRVHVCIALPIVVGAWPMAGMLWRLFEYYYYCTVSAL